MDSTSDQMRVYVCVCHSTPFLSEGSVGARGRKREVGRGALRMTSLQNQIIAHHFLLSWSVVMSKRRVCYFYDSTR